MATRTSLAIGWAAGILLAPGPRPQSSPSTVERVTSTVTVTSTPELRKALASARPGTTIRIARGEYEGFQAANVAGAPQRPIVIAAADPKSPPRFSSSIHLSDVVHVRLEGIEIAQAKGNGLNVDDGGTFDTPSRHLVLRDLLVRDCGGRGNDDGIKLSGVEDFRLERCTVVAWGRGGSAVDMVRCRRGTLEDCTFRDREADPAATGVQLKGGTRDTVVRRCHFEHAGTRAVNVGGSTGLAYFRALEGHEAKDVTVEGCTFVGSLAPIAFAGADGATVRWNTFFRPRRWFLRILQETREPGFVPCRNGTFAGNLIAYRSDEVATPVNVGPGTAAETFAFERNYWFCIDEPARGPPRLPSAERGAVAGADPRFLDPEHGDLRLASGSPARAHGAHALPR